MNNNVNNLALEGIIFNYCTGSRISDLDGNARTLALQVVWGFRMSVIPTSLILMMVTLYEEIIIVPFCHTWVTYIMSYIRKAQTFIELCLLCSLQC